MLRKGAFELFKAFRSNEPCELCNEEELRNIESVAATTSRPLTQVGNGIIADSELLCGWIALEKAPVLV